MQAQANARQEPEARPPRGPTPEELAAKPPDGVCAECRGPSVAHMIYDVFKKRHRWIGPSRICDRCSDAVMGQEHQKAEAKQRTAARVQWARAGFPEDLGCWDFDQLWDASQAWKTGDDLARWQKAWQIVKTWHGHKGALILRGPVGTGKSALAAAAAKALFRLRGVQPVYLSVPDLNGALGLKNRIPDRDAARERLWRAPEAGLLVFDDLAVSKLFVDCQRYVGIAIARAQKEGKPMIITTNASLAQMAKRLARDDEHGRVTDRLAGYGTEVLVEGESFRCLRKTRGVA